MSVGSSIILAGILGSTLVALPGRSFESGPRLPVQSVYELDQPRLITAPLGVILVGDGAGHGERLSPVDGQGDGGIDFQGLGLVAANEDDLRSLLAEHRQVFRQSLAELNQELGQIMPPPMTSQDPRLKAVAELMLELDEQRLAIKEARRFVAEHADDEVARELLEQLQDERNDIQAQLAEAKLAIVQRVELEQAAQEQLELLRQWDLRRIALEAAAAQSVEAWAESQGFPDGGELVDGLRRQKWIGLSSLSGEGIDLSSLVAGLELGRAARDVVAQELLGYEQALHAALVQRELVISQTQHDLRQARFDGEWSKVAALERERLVAALAVRGVNDVWLARLVELVEAVNPANAATLQSEGLRAAYPRVFAPSRDQQRIARAMSVKELTPIARTQAMAAQAALQEQLEPVYLSLVEAVRAYEPLRSLADVSPESDEGSLTADVALAGARLRALLAEQQRLEDEAMDVFRQYVFDSDQVEMDRLDRAIDPTMQQEWDITDSVSESP